MFLTDNNIEYDEKRETVQDVGCGESTTTCYLLGGTVVRQDVAIRIYEGVLLGGEPGQIGG